MFDMVVAGSTAKFGPTQWSKKNRIDDGGGAGVKLADALYDPESGAGAWMRRRPQSALTLLERHNGRHTQR